MRFIGLVMSALLLSFPVWAKPDHLGTYKDWSAFAMRDGGSKTCFMLSEPKDKNPKNVKRGKVYMFVSHTNSGSRKAEINLQAGYPFAKDSTATAKVGSAKFTLFTENEDAWVQNLKDQPKMIAAMRKGSRLTITGKSRRGTRTVDHYSLSGFTKAYQTISRECGV
ncbi:MAG: invasion associated locus B family protein [Alphaproteobacteria bacterium]